MTEHPLKVAIIGAGMGGLFMAEQLRVAGIDYTIFEKAPEVGGTWQANTYPGLFVDVLTRSYEFPFARHHGWSRRYAAGSEIQDYLVRVSRTRGFRQHIRFNTEIVEATFNDAGWDLIANDGGRHRADVVIAATGFLRVPSIPDLPGRESFAGPAFHSSAWDHSADLEGKRIGVIGTGSSGVQIVTELGKRGHDVTQFVRTPQWMMVRENPKISLIERLLLAIPGTAKMMDARMMKMRRKIEGPDTWRFRPGPDRDRVREQYAIELEKALPDPTLRAKLTPTEPAGCKRIAKTQHYYDVVQQPNVSIVAGGVSRLEPEGIVDSNGQFHPIDVLIYATGFDSHAYMRPMKVTGAGGHSIEEIWRGGVVGYKGVGIPHMPNFFMLNGPFAPVNLIPPPAGMQDQAVLIMRLIEMARRDHVAIAPTDAATRHFCDEVRAEVPNTTFGDCDNWFTDKSGTPIVWPWNRTEHARRLAEFDMSDFEIFWPSARKEAEYRGELVSGASS